MTSTEENVTTTPELETIAVQTMQPNPPGTPRRNRNPCRRGRVRCSRFPNLLPYPFASSSRIAAQAANGRRRDSYSRRSFPSRRRPHTGNCLAG
jgi:hypothetical protein